ncbi:NUDIX hydrolase [Breznakia sp. OttesenSCG-928-G09]|nr:NUDIX hydrolase [Breznakia sp. OttesenSCG-928-G09]
MKKLSYIEELRTKVGSKPLLSIGATIIVINKDGEILLNLRSDTKTWGIPGGGMELGETISETAIRELYEETNLISNDLEFIKIFSGNDFYFKYPNGDELYSVIALFITKNVTGNLKISDDESLKLQYFNLKNLPVLESRAQLIMKDFIVNNYYSD